MSVMVRVLVVMGLMVLAAGCRSGGKAVGPGPDGLPEPFELTLRAVSEDGRSVYYVVEPGGRLRFGGGRAAILRQGSVVGELTAEERERLWRIVEEAGLMAAEGGRRAEPEEVTYEAEIRAGGRRQRLRAVDEQVAGLGELERALFAMQAERRYGAVVEPIEARMREGEIRKRYE